VAASIAAISEKMQPGRMADELETILRFYGASRQQAAAERQTGSSHRGLDKEQKDLNQVKSECAQTTPFPSLPSGTKTFPLPLTTCKSSKASRTPVLLSREHRRHWIRNRTLESQIVEPTLTAGGLHQMTCDDKNVS
jgi:hypothetical protein